MSVKAWLDKVWNGEWRVSVNAYDGKIRVCAHKGEYTDVDVWCTTAVQVFDAKVKLQTLCDDRNRAERWARDTARRYR